MGRPAILKVDIIGDAKGLNRAVDDTDSRLGKLGKSAGLLGKVAGAAALGGIAALGAGLVAGIGSAASYETLSNKLAGTIKSTGNAANVSVAGLQKRAGALESLSGIDEELILNGQNVLLTFTNVRNEVGRGNDVFDRATKAAAGMSVTLGTDLAGSSLQVGKALNDPLKGITSLSRAGVQFTAQQKAQIKTMVESGDKIGAQKIILGELETQFGSAAEAAGKGFNGALARVKDLVGDTARGVGQHLLPTLTTAGNWLVNKGAPAAARFAHEFGQNIAPALRAVGGFITGTVIPAGLQLHSFFVEKIVPAIRATVLPILNGLRGAFGSISRSVEANSSGLGKLQHFLAVVIPPAAKILGTILGTTLGTAFRVLGAVIGGVIGTVSRLVNLIDTAVSKIRGLASLARTVGGALGKLNPFGGVPLLIGTPGRLGMAPQLARPIAGLATAAAGSTTGSGFLSVAGAGGMQVVDRRTIRVDVRIDGDVLDGDGLVRKLQRAGDELAVRLGRTTTFGAPA